MTRHDSIITAWVIGGALGLFLLLILIGIIAAIITAIVVAIRGGQVLDDCETGGGPQDGSDDA